LRRMTTTPMAISANINATYHFEEDLSSFGGGAVVVWTRFGLRRPLDTGMRASVAVGQHASAGGRG
jgi:hypothetical protein